LLTSNDLAEPVTFLIVPIATPSERNLLLSQRAEGTIKQIIAEKCKNKRRRSASRNPKIKINISTSITTSK